jgi:ATP-binding cassette subfamily B multidrug efflux pump
LIPHFKAHWRIVGVGLLSLIVVDMLQLTIPRVIKGAVDSLTALDANASSLALQAATIGSMALFIGIFRYIWRRCLLGTARRLRGIAAQPAAGSHPDPLRRLFRYGQDG